MTRSTKAVAAVGPKRFFGVTLVVGVLLASACGGRSQKGAAPTSRYPTTTVAAPYIATDAGFSAVFPTSPERHELPTQNVQGLSLHPVFYISQSKEELVIVAVLSDPMFQSGGDPQHELDIGLNVGALANGQTVLSRSYLTYIGNPAEDAVVSVSDGTYHVRVVLAGSTIYVLSGVTRTRGGPLPGYEQLLATFHLLPASTVPTPDPPLSVFRDQAAGFSVAYPKTWIQQPQSSDRAIHLVLAVRMDSLDTLLVRVIKIATPVDTSNVGKMKAFTDSVLSGVGVVVVEEGPVILNGNRGYYYRYAVGKQGNGQQLVHLHYFIFHGSSMFALVFQSTATEFEALSPVAKQVIDSFETF